MTRHDAKAHWGRTGHRHGRIRTCSLGLLEEAAEYFGLGLLHARTLIKEVAIATSTFSPQDPAQREVGGC
jgi:hypothetical protein